jgi:hypothetical protein
LQKEDGATEVGPRRRPKNIRFDKERSVLREGLCGAAGRAAIGELRDGG